MVVQWKKGLCGALVAVMLVGLFGGCSNAGGRTFPTPTPRAEKENEKSGEVVEALGGGSMESNTSALLQPAGSYEAVYEALKKVQSSGNYRGGFLYTDGFAIPEESVDFEAVKESATTAEPEAMAPTGNTAGESGLSFSETNVQVEGIDEGDIIKTDGAYFYIFNQNRNEIYIVSVSGGQMGTVAVISAAEEFRGNETGREMYLVGDRLVLIVSGYRMELVEEKEILEEEGYESYGYKRERAVTVMLTYDISEKTAPKLLSSLEQDGRLVSSRCTGGTIYVISSYGDYYNWYYAVPDQEDTEAEYVRYIPQADGERIAPECIYISDEPVSEEFLVVTAMSPEHPQSYLDVKSLLADGDECYVSNNYIYVGSSRWQNRETPYDRTELYRFAYADGVITPAGQVTVKGTLDDQFSMDEYNGYLRVVTTVNEYEYETEDSEVVDYDGNNVIDEKDIAYSRRVWIRSSKEYNALYIYDENLQLTGSIEDLAPEEQIKSARLMGEVGYFVTFRQTDPLFSVDLSDPANPKVLGELKIPGFSAYLHPYGENLLLGIGYDADEVTGWTECVKLSMFDVSDPTDVKEVHTMYLEDFTSTAVEDNHKAALIDAEKNLIGLPARGYKNNSEYNVYLVFGYDAEIGFYQKLSEGYAIDWGSEFTEFKYELLYSDCRGAYIEDIFYMINPSYEVKAYDMETWEQTGRVGLVKEIEERQALLEKIREKNPEPIVIELDANPSTGYAWSTTTEGGAVSLSTVETIATEEARNLPGAPVTERYTFEVKDIGETTVTFEYARVWELNKPLRKMVYKIRVDENFVAWIDSVTEE